MATMKGLENSKLFGGILGEELRALSETAHMRRYKPGENIFIEGDPGDGLYVVIEGQVQITALVTKDERRVLSKVGPGDFFGEMAALDSEARSATATANVESQLFFIARDELLTLLERSPKLALRLVREFSLRMRQTNRKFVDEVLQAERLTLVGRFARSIVHDFKNPLNVIGLAAEIAGMEGASPEMRLNAQKRIQRQVSRMSIMINELLEFTRGAQANVVLAQTEYGPFMQQVIDEVGPEVEEKSVKVLRDGEFATAVVLMDPQRMTRLFFNLVHNAVDAMPNGGKVFIRVKDAGKELVTEVEDTGSGIAPEIALRLFEPFATHGKAHGTGLGLSICKRIIEDHRGRIEAVSQPGHGALFRLYLPKPG
jgi:signal transduction histidine kinase